MSVPAGRQTVSNNYPMRDCASFQREREYLNPGLEPNPEERQQPLPSLLTSPSLREQTAARKKRRPTLE